MDFNKFLLEKSKHMFENIIFIHFKTQTHFFFHLQQNKTKK